MKLLLLLGFLVSRLCLSVCAPCLLAPPPLSVKLSHWHSTKENTSQLPTSSSSPPPPPPALIQDVLLAGMMVPLMPGIVKSFGGSTATLGFMQTVQGGEEATPSPFFKHVHENKTEACSNSRCITCPLRTCPTHHCCLILNRSR